MRNFNYTRLYQVVFIIVISKLTRQIIFYTFIACGNLFSQSTKIIKSTPSELIFRITFQNPSKGYSLENEYVTIGLPTENYPEMTLTPIKSNNISKDQSTGPFYSAISNYGEWNRLEKFRNLNVAILKLAPTTSNDAEISLLELEVKIRFTESIIHSESYSKSESLIYSHRILNWPVAKSWLKKPSISRSIKSQRDLNGDWYKISISNDGVYGISGSQLLEIGANISDINPSTLRIFTNPQGGRPLSDNIFQPIPENLIEIAIKVSGTSDGTLNDNDKIIFYGRGPRGFDKTDDGSIKFIRNPYTDLNVYWLNVPFNPEIRGLRIETVDENLIEPITINYGIAFAHSENEEYNPFESGLLWVGPGITKDQTLSIPIQLHHPRDDINAKANLSLFGGSSTESEGYPAHIATIQQRSQADSILIRESWFGIINRNFSLNLDEKILDHGTNFFILKNSTSDNLSKIFIDWITVEYASELIWEGSQFDYWAPTNLNLVRFMISKVNSDIKAWDITDINSPVSQAVELSGNRGYFELEISSKDNKRFVVYNELETLNVADLEEIGSQTFSTLRTSISGIDHIIITPEVFLEPAEKLREHRDFSIVVPLEVIYNEFSGGVSDPKAIRVFLKWVKENWSSSNGVGFPSYILLLGDGDYDYRNITGNASNLVPTFQSEILGETSSDDKFAYLDGKSPDMAIGRLPASNLNDAEAMVDKTINYEADPEIGLWRSRVSLIADDFARPNFGALELTHTKNSEEIARLIPKSLQVQKLYMEDFSEINDGSQYGVTKPSATQALFDLLNEGTALLNYIGHGSAYQWAQEGLLSSSRGDLTSIQTGNKLPIWLAATCSWGQYDNLEGSAMSEEILRSPNNAGVAVISTNGLITFSANRNFIIKLFQSFFPDTTVSDLSLGAIFSSIKDGSRGSQMFHLLGDPGLKIALPSKSVDITSVKPDTLTALNPGSYFGTVSDIPFGEGSGFVTLSDAERTIKRHYENGSYSEDIIYNMPGNTLFRGKLSFTSGAFEGSFILPKDITTSVGGKLSAYLYNLQEDGLWEGTGLNEGLILRGGTTNPIDSNGPLISFGLDERTLQTGDNITIGKDLIVSLSDPLGINITGDIGHGIQIWFEEDDANSIDLTNEFLYSEGSHTSGSVIFSLSNALPGEISITAEAWDNANNVNRESVTLNINSNEALELTNVFNYPNPFKYETQFGFEVNKNALVKIKIFTIAGELISELEPLESFYGYSHIDWDGRDYYGDIIANGVYLYQITATSIDDAEESMKIGKAAKYR